MSIGKSSPVEFVSVPINGRFELKGDDTLYVRTVRMNGSNAESYDGEKKINVSLANVVRYYPQACINDSAETNCENKNS